MVTFHATGGRAAANALVRAAGDVANAPTLGDIGTTRSRPASSPHRALSVDDSARLVLEEGSFQISVGVEPVELLIAEFIAAIDAAQGEAEAMAAVSPAELLNAFPLPAILIDRADRIVAMNDGAQRLLSAALLGRHYITGLRQPDLLDAIEGVRSDGIPRRSIWLSRSGARDTTWLAHVARADAMLLVSFEDRTVAEEADQMRRDFVANVSHELKTPLTALVGFIETLNGPARDDPKAGKRFLGIMAGEAQRMHRLVEDLLSLSRVEADERRRPTTPVDLHPILSSVVALLRPLADERGVDLAFDDPGALPPLPADADQLRQVFANLVENAVKYGGDRVEVAVDAGARLEELRGPGVRVCVIDNGRGIDEIHLPRLTQRFYRVDAHRSREVGGTGLGLAIVKHIVSRHRGRLRITSTPGKGSTFSVALPSLQ